MTTTAIDGWELDAGPARLRVGTDADVDAITRVCRDPETQRWTRVPSPYERHHAQEFVEAQWRGAEAPWEGLALTIADLDSDALLGAVGLDVDAAERSADLGFWVAPEARGRGVATAAARRMCALGFERLDLARISMHAAVGNEASNRVAHRLGFRHEGVLRAAHIAGPSGDPDAPRMDMHAYGLLPGELR